MTQTVTVTQASIADLIEQRDALLKALKGLGGVVNAFGFGGDNQEIAEAIADARAAIAKASPIAGLTEIGGRDEQ